MDNLKLDQKALNELNNYTKYLKYKRNNAFLGGNKNWIIIDSTRSKSKSLIEAIETINTFNRIITNTMYDYSYFSQKYGFDKNKFNSDFRSASEVCNILVFSALSESIAQKEYSGQCTFYINYNNTVKTNNLTLTNIKEKKEKIITYIRRNKLELENEKSIDNLIDLSDEQIDKELTRAIITTLNHNSHVIKDEYFNICSTNKNAINELDNIIGLENVKNTLKEIINYLNIAKKRDDMPCINMCFLGNPRNRKNLCC